MALLMRNNLAGGKILATPKVIPVCAVTRFRNKMADRNNFGDSFLCNNDYSPLFTDGPVSRRETLVSGKGLYGCIILLLCYCPV